VYYLTASALCLAGYRREEGAYCCWSTTSNSSTSTKPAQPIAAYASAVNIITHNYGKEEKDAYMFQ
jgi:hypothetical protein